MSYSLIDEVQLSDIPEVSEAEVKASLEALAIPSNTQLKDDGDETAPENGPIQSPNNVSYTISTTPSGTGKIITFYLNTVTLCNQAINQFVMLCDCLVGEQDVLMVHFNSVLYCEEAETLYNAILDCKARVKIGSAPYTLNTAALFPILACDYMLSSPWCFAHFDVPSIKAGGIGHKDARNAYEYDTKRKMRLLDSLRDAGFIPADRYEHIVEKQGSFTLYGPQYAEVIKKFNARKSR